VIKKEYRATGLEFGKNKGKASLVLNVTKFFRASRPVYRASRAV
jgi:hypothetical protein